MINDSEIKVLSQYIYNISGIALGRTKAYLLEGRLGQLVEKEGCSSYIELYHKAKSDTSKSIDAKIVSRFLNR